MSPGGRVNPAVPQLGGPASTPHRISLRLPAASPQNHHALQRSTPRAQVNPSNTRYSRLRR